MQTNPQLELANELLKYTNTNLFLTGKAGTGKTTFLKNLKLNSPKRMIVVAPTGVAAINAGGVTIHSFFQLNFGPYIPGTPVNNADVYRFRKEKINIIKSLDLLVIDEISMVRADLLDSIDNTLRHFRRNTEPFGGVQLLMIGDIQQLSPVIKEEEWTLLSKNYQTPYFFSSLALQKTSYACVELKTVYRQSDDKFVNILNRIRENKADAETLKALNMRYVPNFNPADDEGYIRLTTHNYQAQQLNKQKLDALTTPSHFFKASTTGNFQEYAYPTDENLELKVGAQVMFIKNDSSPEKLYYNGKIGRITKIEKDVITVVCKENDKPIFVQRETWENIQYTINKETKELEESIDGTFVQFPLKTAWAITVHKSQGLTFEKAIIDAQASFAHGQVYVALSRCKTLEGLILSSPILSSSIKRDSQVDQFNKTAQELEPNEAAVASMRQAYTQKLIIELFNYKTLLGHFLRLKRIINESFYKLYPSIETLFSETEVKFRNEITNVSERFFSQLQNLFSLTTDLENDALLKERISKGATYFLEKNNAIIATALEQAMTIETDNKEIRKDLNNALTDLETELHIKNATLKVAQTSFDVSQYLSTKAKASLDNNTNEKTDKKSKSSQKNKKLSVPKDIAHQELYTQLRSWREEMAESLAMPVYVVLNQNALVGICNFLPTSEKELLKITGIGKLTIKKYGNEILSIVEQCINRYGYEKDNNIFLQPQVNQTPKAPKIDTQQVTLDLFLAGKTIPEIALNRSLTESTIEGHLYKLAAKGKLDLSLLCSPQEVNAIKEYERFHLENKDLSRAELKEKLGCEWKIIEYLKEKEKQEAKSTAISDN